jgi:cardiolipin synthase
MAACIVGLASGCQVPAARFAEGARGPRHRSALYYQLAGDSGVHLTHRPLHTALDLAAEPVHHLVALGEGAVGKRVMMPFMQPAPLCGCQEGAPPPSGCSETGARPARIRLYVDGSEALAALAQMIDEAAFEIDVLMFEWENGPLGAALAERLAARAGPNLHVRVLVDGGGNLVFGRARGDGRDVNRVVSELAHQPYVEVIRIRNPFFRFDHRKLVVADGRIAWSGGRNFTERNFTDVHDLSFTVAGPLAAQMRASFEQEWRTQGGRSGPALPELASDEPANAEAMLLHTEPSSPQIQAALYSAIDHAQQHVYLENFTFSDSRVVYKLARARQRGVDVRVVMTLSCSVAAVNHTNRVTANRLLHTGVRVFIYPGMTHVKAAAVDGCWAYLGTANFDPLSLRHNREIGVAINGGPVVAEVEDWLFAPDFCPQWELKEPLRVSAGDYVCELISSICL